MYMYFFVFYIRLVIGQFCLLFKIKDQV